MENADDAQEGERHLESRAGLDGVFGFICVFPRVLVLVRNFPDGQRRDGGSLLPICARVWPSLEHT